MHNQQSKENNGNKLPKSNRSTNIVGFVIIFFGLAILFKNMHLGHLVPSWIFGWETILIIIGLVIGVNSKFQKKSSIVLIAIGSIFLLKNELGSVFGNLIIPLGAIGLGLYLIKRNREVPKLPPTTPRNDDEYDWDKRVDEVNSADLGTPLSNQNSNSSSSYASNSGHMNSNYKNYLPDFENYLKVDNFFSDTKKIVLSKNFLGGNITSVFGSTNLNFLQADLKQPVVIDTFQLFGSTKIIVPTNWKVSSNVASVFGELDDRRPLIEMTTDDNKKIYITGTSIFGGLTIRNS